MKLKTVLTERGRLPFSLQLYLQHIMIAVAPERSAETKVGGGGGRHCL